MKQSNTSMDLTIEQRKNYFLILASNNDYAFDRDLVYRLNAITRCALIT